jgi:nucleotide-binding universal stress UspA family protein
LLSSLKTIQSVPLTWIKSAFREDIIVTSIADLGPVIAGIDVYKRVLIATDGSRGSSKAVKAALRLCAALRAEAIGVYVISAYAPLKFAAGIWYGTRASRELYNRVMQEEAWSALCEFDRNAQKTGIDRRHLTVKAEAPWQGILDVARKQKCDLIVMASHGRRGLSALLLGSETTKVLTHSAIPVLVYR